MRLLNAILKNHVSLSSLTDKANELTVIQQAWNTVVPSQLQPFTQAGNVQHKRLTVYVENGAVAAKIKLMLPTLLSKLQKQGLDISSIRVQVQVQSNSEKTEKAPRSLSDEAAKSVGSLANQLKGSALGDVLERLAKRTKS